MLQTLEKEIVEIVKKEWRIKKKFVCSTKKREKHIRINEYKNIQMQTMLHISNWPLRSFSTIEGTVCGFAFNNIDFKQPRPHNRPGIE